MSWSSLEVIYTQPPQERVRTIPDRKTTVGSEEDVEWCRKYWRNTMAKRGPVDPSKLKLGMALKASTCSESYKELEDVSLWIPVTNSSGM
jgi:hypothetical protein